MVIKATFIYAIAMILLGVGGYVGTGMASMTALIPAIIGFIFLVLAVVGMKEGLRKHVMHVASLLTLLALFGTARGTIKAVGMLLGDQPDRPAAVVVQAITFFATIILLAIYINSFIQARKRRLVR